jgi:hypothetical protein
VPFSWGAPLSGVADSADIGWYGRSITAPEAWRGRRVFLVFGASDWFTTAWLDGKQLGTHQGGYTPFAFELTSFIRAGSEQRLVVRVDDTQHPFKLEGKQGYGKARGMWQTVYLEARGTDPLESVHFTPKADLAGVGVDVRLATLRLQSTVRLTFANRDSQPSVTQRIARGGTTAHVDVPLPQRTAGRRGPVPARGHVERRRRRPCSGQCADLLRHADNRRDQPAGESYPYVAINGTPVFLQLALDQPITLVASTPSRRTARSATRSCVRARSG